MKHRLKKHSLVAPRSSANINIGHELKKEDLAEIQSQFKRWIEEAGRSTILVVRFCGRLCFALRPEVWR